MGCEEPGVKSVRMVYLRQKALWVASGSGDGRAEEPWYDVPQGVGVKNRCEAELTNQRRGSGQKPRCILLYRTVARNGGGIPLSVVCPFFCGFDQAPSLFPGFDNSHDWLCVLDGEKRL